MDGMDERQAKIAKLNANHERTSIDMFRVRFGKCKDHEDRDNEYYDLLRNKAFCLMCAIDSTQGRKENQGNLVPI